MAVMIDRSKIAKRAYQIYEKRGKAGGSDFTDWLQAEKELLNEEKTIKQPVKKNFSFK